MALDSRIHPGYHASIMDAQVTAQLTARAVPQSIDSWYYFYFTPPAMLVGLSELRR